MPPHIHCIEKKINMILLFLFFICCYKFILKANLFHRIFCPSNCKTQPSYWSPVFGNNIYTDVSNASFYVNYMFWMNFCSCIMNYTVIPDRKGSISGSGYIRTTFQAFLVHGKTVGIWLMENVSNGEGSQRLPEMHYPASGVTIQRFARVLSQMKPFCLADRRHRKK